MCSDIEEMFELNPALFDKPSRSSELPGNSSPTQGSESVFRRTSILVQIAAPKSTAALGTDGKGNIPYGMEKPIRLLSYDGQWYPLFTIR